MAGGLKLSFIAEVRQFLTGTKRVEEALDDVSSAVDDVAEEAQRAGDEAGRDLASGIDDGTDRATDSVERLERSFRDMAKHASKSSKSAGDELAAGTKHGTARAEESVQEFHDEARANFSEVTSSFSGDMSSAVDVVQGTLGGLAGNLSGPLGAALGVAAAGVGLVFSKLEESAEQANALKQRVLELAAEISAAGGNLDAVDLTGKTRAWGLEVKDVKSAWEFWQKDSTSNFELMERAAGRFGLNLGDLLRGMSGSDSAAAARAMVEISKAIEVQEDKWRRMPPVINKYDTAQQEANQAELDHLNGLKGLRTELEKNSGVTEDAVGIQQRLDAALGESAAAAEHAAAVQSGYADAMAGMADPVGSYEEILSRKEDKERATAQATADATKSGEDSWEDYAHDVNVTIDDLLADLDAQIAAAQNFETNLGIIAAAGGQAVADELRAKGPEVAGATAALIAEAGPDKLQAYIQKYGTATGAATTGAVAAGIAAGAPTVAAAVRGLSDHVGSITIPVNLDTKPMAGQLEAWRRSWVAAHGGVSIPTKIPQVV